MHSTTSFNSLKNEATINYETGTPINTEYYTYYPTWSTKTTTGVSTTSTTNPFTTDTIPTMQSTRLIDDVVISGVSGRFPESDNIEEFAKNLYDGVDMVTEEERRWPNGLFGLPKRNGTLKDITKFDAQFFGINPKQVDNMDPQLRLLLEVTYEAIFDSGFNPNELRGTRTGVFIGSSSADALHAFSTNPEELSGYSMTGCAGSMLANRISFVFDFKGPSYTIDTACSSSLVALDAAMNAIKTGECDYAIVGGVNILSKPQTSLQFMKLGMLSPEGKCRSFDVDGKGYVRSETIGAIFLQKKSTCRRWYSKIINSKVNTDGAKEQGITYPSGEMQARLLREIYAEANIDPALVTYIEAHGTGTKAGDPQELNAIAEVFTRTPRSVPLYLGSTKSNMGHPEPASGIAALVKMLISIQRGVIPANLHYQEPNKEVPALIDGRIRVVNKHTKFTGGLMALNSFGFGGVNAHILLQPNNEYMLKRVGTNSLWNQDLTELQKVPRVFQFCARTQEGIERVLDYVQQNPTDLSSHILLQPNSTWSPSTHPYRGYTILNGEQTSRREWQQVSASAGERPIWYIFSGMGTQWYGMGQELMKIDTFRQSIRKSAEILRPYGINLIENIYGKPNVYDRTLNAFVGIASIQIALVDCLRQAGISPDGIIGHSVGELGCAYADNCFTAEETLLAAYYRGKCIEEAQLPMGAMAAVGLTWEECQRRCPSGVVPACHNSQETVTISGPKMAVLEFIEQLRTEGVFVKEVDSSNVAFHSYYMTAIAPALKMALEKVIRTPKLRSSKWISTSIPEQRWESELARYSSADYHVNNLCSPVLFQEALKRVPANAITIEIAPHALLQAILKRSLSPQTVLIPLMKKDAPSQVEHLLNQLGRLYVEGVNIDSVKLALPVGYDVDSIYPVPYNTNFLSHLVKWDHQQSWNTPKYDDFLLGAKDDLPMNTSRYTIDVGSIEEDTYLTGHQIDGRVLYPATGYLYLIWKTLAKMQGITEVEQLPVVFENVEIHRATILSNKEQNNQPTKVTFTVTIAPKNGLFEVVEGDTIVVTGRVYTPEQPIEFETVPQVSWTGRQKTDLMEQEEIYKELRLRGYEYQGEFQPIIKADTEGTQGELLWTGKWIPFLDAMLQMNVLGKRRGLLLPTRIRTIRIDPVQHFKRQTVSRLDELAGKYIKRMIIDRDVQQPGKYSVIPVVYDEYTNTTVSGGVEIVGLHATTAPRRQLWQPTIVERVNFVPYVERQFDDEFVFVDKIAGVKEGTDDVLINTEYTESAMRQYREFLNFYLAECKRYVGHIVRKLEYPATYTQTIFPSQLPKTFASQDVFEDVTTMRSKVVPSFGEFLEGGKLLQLLVKVANMESTDGQYYYNVQKAFNDEFAYWKALDEDRVLNFINKRNYYLKSFLDIVVENAQIERTGEGAKLKVLEISPSYGQFFGIKINNFFRTYPNLNKLEYHYLPTLTGTEYQPDEYLYEIGRQFASQIQKVEWNLGLRNGQLVTEPPKYLKDFDLVIFNGSLSTLSSYVDSEFELKQWLQNVMDKVMKPQGFMFIHEYTNNFETLNQLNRLEQLVFRQQLPVMPLQKYQSELQWRQLVEDAGFHPVSLKSDSELSTMFLYRKPTFKVPSMLPYQYEEKIYIDDLDQYSWIEKVKTALNNKLTERVWLISERQPNSGIVGMVNCLRKEDGGEKIRCIFVADKQPIVYGSYLIPTVQEQGKLPRVAQWSQLFDQIRRADLVMNVFRNGKWGSFRHIFDSSSFDNIVIDNDKVLYDQIKSSSTKFRNAYINMLSKGDLSSLNWIQSPEPVVYDKQQIICDVGYAALNFRDIMLATGKLAPEAIPGYYKMQDGLLGMEFSGYQKENRLRRLMGIVPAKGLATTVVVDPRYVWEIPREWTLEQAATIPVAYSTAYYALVVRGKIQRGERVLIHAGSGAVGQAAVAIALACGCKVFVTVSTDEKRDYLKSVFPQLTDDSFYNSRDITFEKQIMQVTRGYGVDVVLNSLADDKLQASIRLLAQHGRFLEIGKFDLNKNSSLGMSVFLKNVSFHGILLDSLFESDSNEWKVVYQLVDEGIRTGVVRPLNAKIFEREQIEDAFRYMAQGKHIGKVLVRVLDKLTEQPTYVSGIPRVWFTPVQTYIVTGGLGGFGLELAQWMVERGARRLILTSRSGVRTGYQTRKLRTLQEEFGAQIKVLPFDVRHEDECVMIIKEATQMSGDKRIGGIFHLAAVLEDGLFENQTPERFSIVNDVKYLGAYHLDKYTRGQDIMDNAAYFVVFSSVTSGRGNAGQTNYGFANSAMERICEYRRFEGKHALAIQWGAIGDVGLIIESPIGGTNDTVIGGTVPQRIVSCLKTLEHLLLKSTEPRDTAIWSSFVPVTKQFDSDFKQVQKQQQQLTQQQKKSLVDMIANIMNIRDVKQLRTEQITLGEMGLDSLMSVEIKQIIEQYNGMSLTMKEIQQLTFEKLRAIDQPSTTTINKGFDQQTFATGVEGLNVMRKINYLMPSRVVERLNQIDYVPQAHVPLFVVHPIEGHVNMLKIWAKHMKYPVFGIQYTQEAMQYDTIEQLADFYWQQIDKELYRLQAMGVAQPTRIHLCGYSFGASVAFEMALRRTTRIASLSLLDGSHSYVTAHVNTYKNKFQLQNAAETEAEALYTFAQQYAQIKSKFDFVQQLTRLSTFDQRVKYAVSELTGSSRFQFDAVDLENAARSFVNKLMMAYKYQPKQALRLNELLLIKSGERSNLVQTVLGDDYGLSQVFNGKLQVQVVDGDHRSFLESTNAYQVASILNEFLLRCF